MVTKKNKPTTRTRAAKTRISAQDKISSFHRRITLIFLVISTLLVLLILYFSLSQVKIYITPEISTLKTTFEVQVDTEATSVLAGTNIIPGKIVTSTNKITKTFPVPEGNTVEGVTLGVVTIINNYSRPQPLVRTTRLLSPEGLLFRLEENVTVPAGGEITTTVYADEPGTKYDIEPSTFTIPGLWEGLQTQIYAESNTKFSGGSRLEKTLTKEILDKSAQEVIKFAREEAKKNIKAEEDSLIVYAIGGSTWESNFEVGQTTDQYSITVETPFTTVEFKRDDLENISLNNLIAETPSGHQFISANNETLLFDLEDIATGNSTATLKVYLEGQSAARLTKESLDINKIIGKNKPDLISYLIGLPEISDVNVVFVPSWLNQVPSLQDRIYIEIVK